MDFFSTKHKFWEQQKKFWDTNIFLEIFVKKLTFWGGGGGGVNVNSKKVYVLNYFFCTLPYGYLTFVSISVTA